MIFAVSISTGLDIWEREYSIVFIEAEDRTDAVGSVNDANRDEMERGYFRVHAAMAMPDPPSLHVELPDIVGKTVSKIEWRTVEGPFGDERCCALIFTDGTEHGFVIPNDD